MGDPGGPLSPIIVRTIWIGLTFFASQGRLFYGLWAALLFLVVRGSALGECCYLPSTSYYLWHAYYSNGPSSTVFRFSLLS